jgi:hypothetical protein
MIHAPKKAASSDVANPKRNPHHSGRIGDMGRTGNDVDITARVPRRSGRVQTQAEGPDWTTKKLSNNVIEVCRSITSVHDKTWFLLRSDAHHDNPHCDEAMELRHLKEAREKGAGIIDNGDLACAMQGRFDKRSNKSCIRPEHQHGDYLDALVRTAADFYQPFAPWWVAFGMGNHETAIRNHHETCLTTRLAQTLRDRTGTACHVTGYSGWVRINISYHGRQASVMLHHYHGSGGAAPVTKGVISTNRIGIYTPDADVVLTGHSHTEFIVPIPRQRLTKGGQVYHDEQLHVRVPGYKDEWADGSSGWSVEKGMGPRTKGAEWLSVWPEADPAQPFRLHYEVTRAR